MRSILVSGLLLLPLLGCEPEPDPPPPAPQDDDDATDPVGPPDCEPELSLDASPSVVMALGLSTFVATGGTGDYVFEFVEESSGAILNELTGAYLAGETVDVVDRVQVTDLGCVGSATADVSVVSSMIVTPELIEILPGGSFTYTVEGGSGEYGCSMLFEGAGGSVSTGCSYTAPAAEGWDMVRISDTLTGEEIDAEVLISSSAAVGLRSSRVFVPVGSTYSLDASGGSGVYEATAWEGSSVVFSDGSFTAESAGASYFTISDVFAGLSTELTLIGVLPQGFPTERFGSMGLGGTALGPGDVTGDGWPDALLSLRDQDVAAWEGGAVFLYAGGPNGLEPSPIQTWAGSTWNEQMGYSMAVADFDGDGLQDLAIGAQLADVIGPDRGVVRVHPGTETGFEQEATLMLSGMGNYDHAGRAIAACDFNGDGFQDLAVGADRAEESSASSNQGSVLVFAGSATGLETEPIREYFAQLPDGSGVWQHARDAKMGSSLAAGDMDGDGLCDLAVGSFEFLTAPDQSSDGAVWLYRGLAAAAPEPGGLESVPVKVWMADSTTNSGSNFGRSLAMGDLDGDGLADLVVGQRSATDPSTTSVRQGAVWVFSGREDFGPPEEAVQVGWEDADWGVYGLRGYDRLGQEIAIGDVTGDGLPDLVVSAFEGEAEAPAPATTGAVHIFEGQEGSLPSTASFLWGTGLVSGDAFGQEIGLLDDVDGDGTVDLLAYAGRDATLGWNAGRPYFVPGDPSLPLVALDLPGEAAGQHIGRGLAFPGDIDGDGWEDLLVGANRETWADSRTYAGLVQLYPGGPEGLPLEASATLRDFTGHSAWDELGWGLSEAGDFNGDGLPDFAIIAEADEAPSSFDGSLYANPNECPGVRSNSGALFVFGGSSDGSQPGEPDFVFYGAQNGSGLYTSAGGFDANGDGYDDLVVGSRDHNGSAGSNTGIVYLLLGRPAAANTITVICSADWSYEGPSADDNLGYGVAGIGDLDGDDCGEFAAGAPDEDLDDLNNQGIVRIFWGWGGAGCPSEARMTLLGTHIANSRLGYSMDGGHDVDGDGLPDLAVGAWDWEEGANDTGAAWVVPGSWIAAQSSQSASQAPGAVQDLVPSGGSHRVAGLLDEEEFGRSVALVPGLSGDRAGLAAGAWHASLSGIYDSGGARIHEWIPGEGLDPQAWAILAGEGWDSRLGEFIAAGSLAGSPHVIVGGLRADGTTLDGGAAYLLDLGAL